MEVAKASDPRSPGDSLPSSAAATVVTAEHFALSGARASTIAESTGRANMFLAAVSGGLVALGLVATASSLGAAFFGFGLVLLPTLAFVGLVTFERTLQTSMEDTEYARRIALLRGYYFEHAPEIAPYLLSVPPAERLHMQRVPGDRWQGYRTVAGMLAVITAVLAGSSAALTAILIFDHSLAAAGVAGAGGAPPLLIAVIRHEGSAGESAPAQPPPPRRGGGGPPPRHDRDDPTRGFGGATRRRRAAPTRRGVTGASSCQASRRPMVEPLASYGRSR